jgi:AcrR family transcriptional regulator
MTETSHPGPRRTTREAIVAAALGLIDEVGIDGLTMRKLARAVDVPPMSLYLHFPSKEKLLDLMYQEVAFRLYADLDDESVWQSGLTVLCQRTRTMFLAHPEWVRLLTRPAVPASVPLRERLLKQMLDAGIPANDALGSIVSANFVALGLALGQLAFRDSLTTLIERSSASPLQSSPSEELRFAHTTRALIAGLEARLIPAARTI